MFRRMYGSHREGWSHYSNGEVSRSERDHEDDDEDDDDDEA